MMIWVVVLLTMTTGICSTDNDGWKAVQRDVMINYDLENSPLQIRINGLPGGTAQVGVKFFDAGGMDAGGVFLKFSFPLQYQLGNCTNWTNVSTGASPATSEVWTITVKRISDEKRVVITSNDNDVLDLVLVLHETCKDNSWETSWSRDVEKIMFSSPYDTAEDSYRRTPLCTGLKTEWTSTMETITQFPVNPGTIVEVMCSYSDAVYEGSNDVTCKKGKHFSFSKKPLCTIPGWTAVQRGVLVNYDLENFPLQIRTNSEIGSNEEVALFLYDTADEYSVGAVKIKFTSPLQCYLDYCSTNYADFHAALPTETVKVWTITLSRISGERSVVIHCNDTKVFNMVLSDSTCSNSDWRTNWSKDVEMIKFSIISDSDTASDYYRPAPICTGLRTEWTSTMETTTQFPVDSGTIVEVTCSYYDAVNKGSSEVTCIAGRNFTFSEKPRCTIPGWTEAQRNVYINHNLENSPLQIRTNIIMGRDKKLRVLFHTYNRSAYAGGVYLYFSSPPQLLLNSCSKFQTNFPTALPTETDKIWTIILDKTASNIILTIHCNNKKVLNIALSDTTCKDGEWKKYWGRKVEKIYFPSSPDTASDYYRPAPDCTGLKTEWTSTMETTTQFPVNLGTVVEVTCSYSDAVNEGSSEVTCIAGRNFTFSEEPRCTISGWTAVQRGVDLEYDLEKSPLQMRTNSEEGSDRNVSVSFYESNQLAGGVSLYFTSPPQYSLADCTSESRKNFSTEIPSETDKVWTITLSRTTGKRRVVIHCNNKEVLSVTISHDACSERRWNETWNRNAHKITFLSVYDTATDYYRPAICTGLKTEWTRTMETTTQFPVKPGTVVKVTCSNPDAVFKGDSTVTCLTGTVFSLSDEPRCPIPDCTGLKTTWTNMMTDKQFPVSTGTVLSLSCNDGYELRGVKTVTCTTNTKFQFSVEPTCVECSAGTYSDNTVNSCTKCAKNSIADKNGAGYCYHCPQRKVSNEERTQCVCPELNVDNAKVSRSGPVTEGTAVTVTCKKPKRYKYVLIGKKTVTCEHSGWSNIPECRKYESATIVSPV